MSHFTSMKVDFKQTHEAELISALETRFGVGKVEVSDAGLRLAGGDRPLCNIVVRGKTFSSYEDIGYKRNADGTYDAHLNAYDHGNYFGKGKQSAIAQEYALKVSEKQLRRAGYNTKRVVKEKGVVQVVGSKFTN